MSTHRFNRRVGLGEEFPSTIGDRIRKFERELACLQAALGPEHQYSVSNVASCAWPAQFVMLHRMSCPEHRYPLAHTHTHVLFGGSAALTKDS